MYADLFENQITLVWGNWHYPACKVYSQKFDYEGNPTGLALVLSDNTIMNLGTAVTSDGGWVLVGYQDNGESYDNLLQKIDEAGNQQWIKNYIDTDVASHVKQCGDGGFILGGGLILKTDAEGRVAWTKFFPETAGFWVLDIKVSEDDKLIILAQSSSQYIVLKIDYDGNVLWQTNLSGTTGYPAEIIQGADSNYNVCYTERDQNLINNVCISKLRFDGTLMWTRLYGDKRGVIGTNIVEVEPNEFAFLGYSEFSAYPEMPFIGRTNWAGNLVWSEKLAIDNFWNSDHLIALEPNSFLITGRKYISGEIVSVIARADWAVYTNPMLCDLPERIRVCVPVGSDPVTRNLKIYNKGKGDMTWNVEESCPWVDASPLSGSSWGQDQDVNIVITAKSLPAGIYETDLLIKSGNALNAPARVHLSVNVFQHGVFYVPSQFETVQEAIDHAVNGDCIVIEPGTLRGPGNRDIDFKGKAITVRSKDPGNLKL